MKNELDTLKHQNQQLSAALQQLSDRLEYERACAAAEKNRIPGGFYMMSRKAEKNLRSLQRNNPSASLVFSVIREHMQIGTNAVTISNAALARIIGRSRATITRAVKYLQEHAYVQIIKSGNTNTYVVNERIAFAGSPGQRKAVFSATVVVVEEEQDEGWGKDVRKLKAVPIVYQDERPILGTSDSLPPPDQQDLPLD